MNNERIMDYVEQCFDDSIIDCLTDYIKIPNKSPMFDEHWQKNGYMEEAITLMKDWCEAHAPKDMTLDIVRIEGRTPLLYIEIPGEVDDTVLLYGHLDKQPEMSGWDPDLAPWKPVLKDGKLYGRGGADDGYAVFSSITAINALQQQGLAHARCVIIIEACEESGSYDLPYYIEQLKSRIGKPSLVVCLDSGAGNYEQLWITTSLRGNIVGELSVELLKEGVHSGNASGIVADSFRIARQVLSHIEDEVTGDITLAELQAPIPDSRIAQATVCAEVLGEQIYTAFPFHDGVEPVSFDKTKLVLNRTWRSALSITGAEGLPAMSDAGNVSRPKTVLKLSMRIPPTTCPAKASNAMQAALESSSPLNAKVTYQAEDGAMGWNAPEVSPWLENACEQASMAFYGKGAVYMGEGGTIPFMGMLGEKFPEAQFMISGVLGPNSNAHGPNEFLHIDMTKRLTACVAYVLYQQAKTIE